MDEPKHNLNLVDVENKISKDIIAGYGDADKISTYAELQLCDLFIDNIDKNKINGRIFVDKIFMFLLNNGTLNKKHIDFLLSYNMNLNDLLVNTGPLTETVFAVMVNKVVILPKWYDHDIPELIDYIIEKYEGVVRSKDVSLLEFLLRTMPRLDLLKILVKYKHKTYDRDNINYSTIKWYWVPQNNFDILSVLMDNFGVDIGDTVFPGSCTVFELAFSGGFSIMVPSINFIICDVEYNLSYDHDYNVYTLRCGNFAQYFVELGDIKSKHLILGGRSIKSAKA
jgi:hypothetical protein